MQLCVDISCKLKKNCNAKNFNVKLNIYYELCVNKAHFCRYVYMVRL